MVYITKKVYIRVGSLSVWIFVDLEFLNQVVQRISSITMMFGLKHEASVALVGYPVYLFWYEELRLATSWMFLFKNSDGVEHCRCSGFSKQLLVT